MRLGYLYSRYPVLSQTFCDMEMLELERRGFDLVVGSIHPPLTSIRHPHTRQLKAAIHYALPGDYAAVGGKDAGRRTGGRMSSLKRTRKKYGRKVKARTRARNAGYFAELFGARAWTIFMSTSPIEPRIPRCS